MGLNMMGLRGAKGLRGTKGLRGAKRRKEEKV